MPKEVELAEIAGPLFYGLSSERSEEFNERVRTSNFRRVFTELSEEAIAEIARDVEEQKK